MKRLTAILVAGIFLLAPLSVSAMEMMDESGMKDVTGQAGVSIAVDDIVLYQESVADTTYWDTDGFTEYTAGAAGVVQEPSGEGHKTGVTISYDDNMKRLITIDAVGESHLADYSVSALSGDGSGDATFDTSAFAADGEYVQVGVLGEGAAQDGAFDPFSGQNEGMTTGLAPITIDVGTTHSLTSAISYNAGTTDSPQPVSGVIIGLPTVEISQYHNNDTRTISIDDNSGNAVNDGAEFIQIENSGSSRMTVLGGTVEIAPH